MDDLATGDLTVDLAVEAPGNDPRARSRAADTSKLITRHLERRSPWPRIMRWAAGILIVLVVVQEVAAERYDRQLSAAIQEVSGNPTLEVHCRRIWDEVFDFRAKPGFVEWGSTTAELQFTVCRDAAAFADRPLDEDTRLGMMILTHELAHLVGHRSESQTECVAMWAAPQTAVALGAEVREGEEAAGWYQLNYNPLLNGEYRAPGCLTRGAPDSPLLR